MAKDPAVLFYTSDFLTGTLLMTNEQVGKYIRLLCLQHQKGRLKEKDMLQICQTYDEDVYLKFEKDKQGFYFNERLEFESNRRKEYSLSRAKNRGNKLNTCKNSENEKDMLNISNTYVKHMENENENENINKDLKDNSAKNFKKIPPEIGLVKEYFSEKNINSNEYEKFFDFYECKNWYVGKNKMTDWKAASRNWIKGMNIYTTPKKGLPKFG